MARLAVARKPIPAATTVTEDMVRLVEIPGDSALAASVVPFDDIGKTKRVTTRALAEGEPLSIHAVADDVLDNGLRSMSLAVPREHAADGELEPGDRVDVIDVSDDGVRYVASGIEVLGVRAASSGSVGSRPTEFTVTVAVDSTVALELAAAMADGELEVIRSTGAPPIQADASGQVEG